MYKTPDLKESPRHLENRIREYWKKHDLAQKSVDIREKEIPVLFFMKDLLRQMANLVFII